MLEFAEGELFPFEEEALIGLEGETPVNPSAWFEAGPAPDGEAASRAAKEELALLNDIIMVEAGVAGEEEEEGVMGCCGKAVDVDRREAGSAAREFSSALLERAGKTSSKAPSEQTSSKTLLRKVGASRISSAPTSACEM